MQVGRLLLIVLASLTAAGCELIVDIFQAGLVVGVILVLLVLGLIGFVVSRFRRRR
jgi:heme/copper-type cytochrome/quinol oxidase subunit 2